MLGNSVNIERLELELFNYPGINRKRELKREIETMKEYVDVTNECITSLYIIIGKYKLKIGDRIGLYVDQNDPSKYYFDIDLLNK